MGKTKKTPFGLFLLDFSLIGCGAFFFRRWWLVSVARRRRRGGGGLLVFILVFFYDFLKFINLRKPSIYKALALFYA